MLENEYLWRPVWLAPVVRGNNAAVERFRVNDQQGGSASCSSQARLSDYDDVTYLTPPLGATSFPTNPAPISAGHPRLSVGHHELTGLPDGAGLVLMDPAEVPDQSDPRRAPRATTSQLLGGVEDGA